MKWLLLLLSLSACSFACKANEPRIVVIDSGVSPQYYSFLCKKKAALDFTNTGPGDEIGHGDNIINIIHALSNKGCIISIKYFSNYNTKSYKNMNASLWAFQHAISLKPNIINYSSYGEIPNQTEKNLIWQALEKGIKVVVPSGNDYKNLDYNCTVFPACYFQHKNLYVVGRNDRQNNVEQGWGFGRVVTDRMNGCPGKFGNHDMCGTSQAVAMKTAELIRDMK